ncbi:MAG: outer membrane lipoprotein carrier protein LolA [Polyangiaceae bacterium]|nr:outer membrane lipoprotein carrier protein LolA [Polyangiaceae bacterium]
MKQLSRRLCLSAAVLGPLGSFLPGPAAAGPTPCAGGLSGILKPFAKLKGFSVDFVEEKRIALLRKPLVNTGSIVFKAPHQLVRRVDAPQPSAIWIKPGQVRIRDASGERNLDVTRWGPANVLIQSFLYVLSGDAESLRKHYRIEDSCEGGVWKLKLTPRAPELAKILRHLVIVGHGATPESLELLDGSGDLSVTRFTGLNTQARFNEAQLKKFFKATRAKP